MRIGGIVVATLVIVLHRARTQSRRDEKIFGIIHSSMYGFRIPRPMISNICGANNVAIAADDNYAAPLFRYRSVFNLIPNEDLTYVNVSTWVTMYDYFNEDIGFISKVLCTLKNDQQRLELFLTSIRIPAADDNGRNRFTLLQTMAQDLVEASVNEETALGFLFQNHPLLFSAPSYFLLKLKNVHKVILLAHAIVTAHTVDTFWTRQSLLAKRTWSKLLLERPNNGVVSLIKRHKNSSMFHVLNTIATAELQHLLATLEENRAIDTSFFRSIDWNTVQIRKIFDFSFKCHNTSFRPDFGDKFFSRLLPSQVLNLIQASNLTIDRKVTNMDQVALPQAQQLFECFIAPSDSKPWPIIDESNCALVGKLLFSQSNSYLSRLYEQRRTSTSYRKILKCLDSYRYSVLQANYILGRDGIPEGMDDRLLNMKGFLAAIPASLYINTVASSSTLSNSFENHFAHILKHVPPHANRMAILAAWLSCKITIGYTKCIESLIQNDANEIVSIISPFEVWRNRENIWNFLRTKVKNDDELKQRVARLPTYVLTQLLLDKQLALNYNQLFNETYPIHLVITGLNCEILSRVPSCDFLPVFEFYNRQRRLYNKEFPKDLQRCAQRAFLNYLRLKSKMSATPVAANLLQYMDLGDIRSIGGFVLATLPANGIMKSKHYRNIVEEIGRLSLPELMLTVTRHHLVSIATQYLSKTEVVDQNVNDVRTEQLVTLGNLTHFLNPEYVKRIHPSSFKFLLEVKLADTRLCADSALRKAWADKLIETFGTPEIWDDDTLLKIGDLLIVMDESSYDILNMTACSRIADLITSKYAQLIEWIPRRLPFYEVCSAILPKNERLAYESSIKRLAIFYAQSIEQIFGTIVRTSRAVDKVTHEQRARSELSTSMYARDTVLQMTSTSDYANSFTGEYGLNVIDTSTTDTSNEGSVKRTISSSTTNSIAIEPYRTTTIVHESETNFDDHNVRARQSLYRNMVASQKTKQTRNREAISRVNDETLVDENQEDNVAQTSILSESTAPDFNAQTQIQTNSLSLLSTMSEKQTTMDTVTFPKADGRFTDLVQNESISPTVSFDRTDYKLTQQNSLTPATVTLSHSSAAVSLTDPSTKPALTALSSTASGLLYSFPTFSHNASNSIVFSEKVELTTPTSTAVHEHYISSSKLTASALPSSINTMPAAQQQQLIAAIERTMFTDELKGRVKRQASLSNGQIRLNISCDTLKILETMSSFVLSSPEVTLIEQTDFDCLELLARTYNLSSARKETIWRNVASKLSSGNLTFVAGRILSAITTEELHKFTFNVHSSGALELIGALSESLSAENTKRVEFSNAVLKANAFQNSAPSSLQISLLTNALGNIICDVNNSAFFDLVSSRNDVHVLADIWTIVYALSDTPMPCLERFANIMIKVYGEALRWEPAIFTTLGPVVAAIPKLFQNYNFSRYFSASAFERIRYSLDFVPTTVNGDQQYLDSIPLTSAMLLLEKDCVSTDRCSFSSSMAHVIIAEDLLQLRENVPPSTSNANILLPFLLLWFVAVVSTTVFLKAQTI